MKDIEILEKINDIDADLLEEAAHARAERKWVKPLMGLLAAGLLLLLGAGAFALAGRTGNKTAAPPESTAGVSFPDYSSAGLLSFEELVKDCDLLFVGTCTKVTPYEPSERAVSFTFSVDNVLGGQYSPGTRMKEGEVILGFSLQNPASDPANYNVFKTGHQYLIPVKRYDIAFEPYYAFCSPALVLDLTGGDYRNYLKKVEIPDGRTIEEYAMEVFNSVDRPEETRKQYQDEFEEFYEESDFICRMKVIEADTAGDGRAITVLSCIETYKGRTEDIYSFRDDGLITIAVRTGTVEKGREYIIGFKAGANALSTPDAVKPVDEELIRKILARNSQK